MKCSVIKFLLIISFISLGSFALQAVPAFPFPIKYKQPDGSEVTIRLRGDERIHWAETSDGYTLLSNGKNGWEYATKDDSGNLKVSGVLAREAGKRTSEEIKLIKKLSKSLRFSTSQINVLKSAWEAKYGSDKLIGTGSFFNKANNSISTDGKRKVFSPNGTKKLLMILIQYPDVSFKYTRQDFIDLMNTQNYNANGALGSVRDFFMEISYGDFIINTDVAPTIYTADYNMAYYGAPGANSHDIRAADLMKEACDKADDDGVDFTQYDNDGDGSVDGVYIIYAGYGEATSGDVNTIWPHAGGITGKTYDGKTVSKYSCSNELNADGTLTSIGVICHEFGHVCGAPDYYDTDYEIGGQFQGTSHWDLMDVGLYNGPKSGNRPAHFNPFEKIRAGWITPVTLTEPASITNMPDIKSIRVVYRINTTTENEYYLLENRQYTGFNASCPGHGLLIYHYSKSIWDVSANKTAPQGFYAVCANASTSPSTSSNSAGYGNINSGGCPFPGTSGITSFTDNTTPTAKSWAGNNTFKPLTVITEDSYLKTISFTYMGGNSVTAPVTQSSNLTASNIQDNQLTLNWTRGSGDKVIILGRRNNAVNTTPLNGTTFTASSSFGTGDQIDPGTYVVYNGSGTSVTITELLKKSSYYFAAFEYNSSDNSYLSPGLTANFTTTGCTPCTPSTTNTGFGISNVSFNTINNSSAYSTGYSDYSEIMTQVNPGSNYVLSVGTHSYTNTIYTKAWIDWNNDCTFQSGEEYDLGSSTSDATVTKTITVPYNANTGYITIRVRARISSAPTSCDLNNYSEAEDYTLKVVNGSTPPTTQASNLSSINVQTDQITLNWTRGNGDKVLVIAHLGTAVDALITSNSFSASPEFGSGTQLGTGNYVIYNGSNNAVTLTGLIPGSTYYFALYEYNSTTGSFLSPALTGSFATVSGCTYCSPTITNPWFGFTNVTFNTINNTSLATQGYVDNSSIITRVIKGQTYTLSATVYTGGYSMYTKAWIDWNKDCTLDPATEEYNLGSGTTTGLTPISPSITIPATAKDGVVKMRLNTRYSGYATPCSTIGYGESEDYLINISSPTTTWDGSSWTPSTPAALYNVIIDGEYNSAGFTCNNLTANAGKHLTIASGTLVVNGSILLHSDENGTATLVNMSEVNTSIKGNVEQYLPAMRNWYVSSPVSNATVPVGYSSYIYREPGDNIGYTAPATAYWKNISTGETFTPGLGYIVLPATVGLTVSFGTGTTGNLNDGNIVVPLTRTSGAVKAGYNLIGNPYPSYVNWDNVEKANVENTIWYRSKNAGNTAYIFDTYNGESQIGTGNNGDVINGNIPPMQGFWVCVKAAGDGNSTTGAVTFRNTMRSHKGSQGLVPDVQLKTPALQPTNQQVLRLQVSNGVNSDETILLFNPNASNGLDSYDSYKMTNSNSAIPEIFSMVANERLAINGLNSVVTAGVLPLGFTTGERNTFTIKATQYSNFANGLGVFIHDNLLNTERELTNGNEYSFTSDETNTVSRFLILFKNSSETTGLDTKDSAPDIRVTVNADRHIILTCNGKLGNTNVATIYNMLGQKLVSQTISESTITLKAKLTPGVYLVSVAMNGVDGMTKKVVIK